jgi:hypothetical protein
MMQQMMNPIVRVLSRMNHLAESWTLEAVDRTVSSIDVWLDRLQQGLHGSARRRTLGRIPDGD